MKTHTLESLIAKSVPVTESGCWLWLGSTSLGYAYASFMGTTRRVHRVVYELTHGPLPTGVTLDHLCRVRCCINPSHLEPVTNKENVLRGIGITAVNAKKTACLRGHPYTDENVYPGDPNKRVCRTCKRARNRGLHKGAGRA